MARRSRMYYIWCDESDKEGEYYSNFYGGILIGSKDLPRVLKKMEQKVAELDITEEIKWQIDKTKTKTGVKELIEGQKNSPAQPTE